jgi:hypothetical protein
MANQTVKITELTAEEISAMIAAALEAAQATVAAAPTKGKAGRNGPQKGLAADPLTAAMLSQFRLEITVSMHGSRGYGAPKGGTLPTTDAVLLLFTAGKEVPLSTFLPVAVTAYKLAADLSPAARWQAIVSKLARDSGRRVVWTEANTIRLSTDKGAGTKGTEDNG